MKKLLLIVLVITGSYQLKAQQGQLKPIDSALLKSPSLFGYLEPGASVLLKQPYKLQGGGVLKDPAGSALQINTIPFASNMPVLKLSSDDRMPIVKPGDPNTHYTLLVKKIKVEDSVQEQVVTP